MAMDQGERYSLVAFSRMPTSTGGGGHGGSRRRPQCHITTEPALDDAQAKVQHPRSEGATRMDLGRVRHERRKQNKQEQNKHPLWTSSLQRPERPRGGSTCQVSFFAMTANPAHQPSICMCRCGGFRRTRTGIRVGHRRNQGSPPKLAIDWVEFGPPRQPIR